jgi:hypothetical protein
VPARAIEDILKVEAAIQGAWIQILTAAGIPVGQLFNEFATNTEVSPRIEINLVGTTHQGHYSQVLPNVFTYSAWQGQLLSRIITRRNLSGQTHDDFLGICRREACYFLLRFSPKVLPWHSMIQMKEASTHRLIDTTRDEDVTELTHHVIFCVRDNAWPAVEN